MVNQMKTETEPKQLTTHELICYVEKCLNEEGKGSFSLIFFVYKKQDRYFDMDKEKEVESKLKFFDIPESWHVNIFLEWSVLNGEERSLVIFRKLKYFIKEYVDMIFYLYKENNEDLLNTL